MKSGDDKNKLDAVVAAARRHNDQREQEYRERALKLYPWVCGRCGRQFTRENLRELTVHHRDHNHDNNPADGSNWELLCLYCHDNEHARYVEQTRYGGTDAKQKDLPAATHKPFADLGSLLKRDD
ncbi:MAG: YajD family HNH nuclease [Gammaproteobacteria bacterium]